MSMESDRLFKIYAGIALVAAAVAILNFDWMLAIAEGMAILIGYYPLRKQSACFHSGLLKIGAIASLLLTVLTLIIMSGTLSGFLWGPVQWIVIIQLLVLSVLTFVIGFMFSVLLDSYTESKFSRRWMLVFAMVFTFAFSAFYTFMTGYAIWAAGMPFTNEEIALFGRVTHPILMADSGCASVAGILCAVIGRKMIKHISKEDLLAGGN